MSPTDIKFFHSGGVSNCTPTNDLGGSCSSCELVSGVDTLFNDLNGAASRAGLIDYRCFYIKNTHSVTTLRNAKFYTDWERKSGSFVDAGVALSNEVQTIEIMGSNPPNENDYMVLNVPSYGNFSVTYSINVSEWQGNFQNSIRGIDGLQDVQVEAVGEIAFPTNVVFTVNFLGQAANRYINLINVIENNLTSQSINVVEIQAGSPINVVACTIPTLTTAPACANFDYYLRGNPVELGNLRPSDQFPVWVRRTTPENTLINIIDMISFNVDGKYP